MKKKLLSLLLALAMVFTLAACGEKKPDPGKDATATEPVVILHTNDVHGAVSNYAKVAALASQYESEGAYVLILDAGDFSQGDTAVSVSEGATAVELMNMGVQFLREHVIQEARIHYAITNTGGYSPNVVQPTAAVLYMVRANKVRDSIKLLARVDKIAQGAALMTETTMERQFIDGTAELLPNYTLERVMQNNLEAVPQPAFTDEERSFAAALKATYTTEAQPGVLSDSTDEEKEWLQEHTQNGTRPLNDFVVPLHSTTAFAAGSTDVGDVSWQTPTVQCYAVTFPSGVPGHSWQNVSCGGSSIGEKGMLYAAQVMAATAIDLFEQPEVLQKAREEFARRSKAGYVCPIEKDAVPTVVE